MARRQSPSIYHPAIWTNLLKTSPIVTITITTCSTIVIIITTAPFKMYHVPWDSRINHTTSLFIFRYLDSLHVLT
ncbi:unnamed protein product [Fusarium graminearum]|nr:unnamed protein product [Fusarium graminearum]